MRSVLSCALAALLAAVPAAAQGTLPLDRARMYPLPSRQVWQAALETVAALGMKVDELDAKHQLLITRFRTYGATTVAGPSITGYQPLRFQLHVFVSPFAEPARVHVGSVSELEKLTGGGTRVMYNGRAAEAWFLDALERRLAVAGVAIPVTREQRDDLAKELSGIEPCQPQPDTGGRRVEEPIKIKASVVEVVYPAPALRGRGQGAVVVELDVGEDGAVYGQRLVRTPQDEPQFRGSALGATSLVRYVPTRLLGCRVPMVMTFTVNYRLR